MSLELFLINIKNLSVEFSNKINEFASKNKANIFVQNDPIGQLAKDGNWFENLEKDFEKLNTIIQDLRRENQTLKQQNYELEDQISHITAQMN